MHLGNAGLILADTRPLALAPVYDMLPMLWRPSSHGEVVPRQLCIALPNPQQQEAWCKAAQMARVFWRKAQTLPALSQDFCRIAATCEAELGHAIARFG